MSLSLEGVCRGERCVYAVFNGASGKITADSTLLGSRDIQVPCGVYPLDLIGKTVDGRSAQDCVAIAMPQLTADIQLVAHDESDGAYTTAIIRELQSKVSSRLLTKRRPELTAAVRGIDGANWSGHTRIEVTDIWPATSGRVVWRIKATFPSDDTSNTPQLLMLTHTGMPLACSPLVMEDQLVPSERDHGLPLRIVTFSVNLPESLGQACIVARLGRRCSGFLPMPARFVRELIDRGHYLNGGAATDGAYERWFDLHRATAADTERERIKATGLGTTAPVLSLVMPVYRTPPEYLRAAIGSVLRQSWQRWQLVVANASPEDAGVSCVLAEFSGEDRIVVIDVENRTIPENTNAGIACATGAYVGFMDHDDVLEPDALWRYAEAIKSHPAADLLYCDEDRLRDGHPAAPAFKVGPQLTLLHSYNYVMHLIMVSRRVLELTTRSGPEVNGAQDYDLTLKAFEVAREVIHIPHVLYHWREHSGSTASGSDQKPFAHVAGKRALEAHLERCGVPAKVEDGRLPYTYRVVYALPEPKPAVSIVIPTRDHADLLEPCVRSILERTTYSAYEVILVENGSVDPGTFSLYEQLTSGSPKVRVVTWTPDEYSGVLADGNFNYSAICNKGAKAAKGDVLVFLNNDTDVIDGDWLTEMVGQLQRPGVGIVGAKLLFEDGLIQHCGVIANPAGDNCHANQNLGPDCMGYGYSAAFPMEWPMVTGACQAIAKKTFEQLGGFDEQLSVGFNDSDLCLSAREKGLASVCTPYAILHHHEFSSRGRELGDPKKMARLLREKSYVMGKHPDFYADIDSTINPNLNPWSGYWELRW